MHSCRAFLIIFFIACGMFFSSEIMAQEEETPIQFSGKLVFEESGELIGAPFVNVYIKSDPSRGTSSNVEGFFSIIAKRGETVVFSSIIFETAEYVVPDTLVGDRYSMFQILSAGSQELQEVVVYPWPRREYFDIEFLAMEPFEELRQIAEENLARQTLAQAAATLLPDGDETSDLYFRQYQQQVYSSGQFQPTNIMNPLAWQKFIKAWKDGKFKSKGKK